MQGLSEPPSEATRTEDRAERVLASARRLIARHGYQGVTMRELARESRVSVPTLYKLFGGKDELLYRAVAAHFHSVVAPDPRGEAEARSGPGEGLARVLEIAEQCARAMLRQPGYTRHLLAAFTRAPDPRELNQTVAVGLVEEFRPALERMQRERQLAAWADPAVLAQRLASHVIITALEWASGFLDDDALVAAIDYDVCTTLLGLARGKALRPLERRARDAQTKAIARRDPLPPGRGAKHEAAD